MEPCTVITLRFSTDSGVITFTCGSEMLEDVSSLSACLADWVCLNASHWLPQMGTTALHWITEARQTRRAHLSVGEMPLIVSVLRGLNEMRF